MKPLVSAIMVTANRPLFVPMAVDCFLKQTYAPKELVIVDDGQVFWPGPSCDQIRYVRVSERLPVGTKWNIAVEAALGDYIIFWADDDWHHPERIEQQLDCLRAVEQNMRSHRLGDKRIPDARLALACSLGNVPYVSLWDGSRWKFTECEGAALDGTYLFTRAYANLGMFPRTVSAQSANWLRGKPAPIVLRDENLYLGTIHGSNAWGNLFPAALWGPDKDPRPLPAEIAQLVGHRDVLLPNKEVVFEIHGWTEEDAHVGGRPLAEQALHAAGKLLQDDRLKDHDLKHVPLVVSVGGQFFRVVSRAPAVIPWTTLELAR